MKIKLEELRQLADQILGLKAMAFRGRDALAIRRFLRECEPHVKDISEIFDAAVRKHGKLVDGGKYFLSRDDEVGWLAFNDEYGPAGLQEVEINLDLKVTEDQMAEMNMSIAEMELLDFLGAVIQPEKGGKLPKKVPKRVEES